MTKQKKIIKIVIPSINNYIIYLNYTQILSQLGVEKKNFFTTKNAERFFIISLLSLFD